MRFFTPQKFEFQYPQYKTKFAWFPVKIWGPYQRGLGTMGTVWLEFYHLKKYKEGGQWFPELINNK